MIITSRAGALSGAPRTWTPHVLEPFAWMDASQAGRGITLGAGGIETWEDRRRYPGAAYATRRLYIAATGMQPNVTASGINGLDVATFATSTSDRMEPIAFEGFTRAIEACSTFFAGNPAVNGSATIQFAVHFSTGASSTNARHSVTFSSSNVALRQRRLDANSVHVNSVAHSAGTHIFGAESSWSTAESTIYVDGIGASAATGQGSGATSDTAGMHAAVGGAQTQASIDGSIGEIIFFQRIVSSAEREMVEGYLAHKWGIASNLPVTHPYYSAPP